MNPGVSLVVFFGVIHRFRVTPVTSTGSQNVVCISNTEAAFWRGLVATMPERFDCTPKERLKNLAILA